MRISWALVTLLAVSPGAWQGPPTPDPVPSLETLAIQVLLDRLQFSPGEIDGARLRGLYHLARLREAHELGRAAPGANGAVRHESGVRPLTSSRIRARRRYRGASARTTATTATTDAAMATTSSHCARA